MVQFPSAADRLAEVLSTEVVRTQSVGVHMAPLVHHVLQLIDFPSIVEHFIGDNGDAEAWKVFEAFIHSRGQSHKPVPLSSLEKWLGRTVLPHVLDVSPEKLNEYRLGRVIEAAGKAPRGLWLAILHAAYRVFGFDLNWDIYDITSIYFEGEYTRSELAQYGYSRDGKPGTKQVNLSLNVTGEDGIPLLYRLLPGSTEDSTTVVDNLKEIRALYQQLGSEHVAEILGDRAMLTPEIVQYYLDANVDFIGAMKASKLTDSVIASVADADLLEHPLGYCAERNRNKPAVKRAQELYYAVQTTIDIPAIKELPASKTATVPCLVVLASGKRRLDEQHRQTLLVRTEGRLRQISGYLNKGKYKDQKFAQRQVDNALARFPAVKGMVETRLIYENEAMSLTSTRNQARIDAAASRDGKYVVLFANPGRSVEEVFRRFKSRDSVEKRADDVKGAGPVVVRPIYLHRDERIRGLTLGCMVALLVDSLIQLAVKRALRKGLTVEALQGTFDNFAGAVHILSDSSQVIVMPTPNKWQRQIFHAVGASIPQAEKVRSTRRYAAIPTPATPPWKDLPRSGTDVPDG